MSVHMLCISILKIIFYQSVSSKINVENMLKLKVVDKYWRSECKWVQQISVEIFDENICSEAQEI